MIGILVLMLALQGLVEEGRAEVPVEESAAASAEQGEFVHPGLLHSADDLRRMRRRVADREEPWAAGFAKLASDRHSGAEWELQGPQAYVSRDPRRSVHNREMVADARAAYQNALMWAITQRQEHARKSIEILNAWGQTLERVGGRDRQLAAGLNGFLLINAAEIIRWTPTGWRQHDVETFERMLESAIYPAIEDFATHANGNWDAACIKTMMAIGVFCDDRAKFDRAVEYYYSGSGNGRLTHYVINERGQCQESGRDQQHTQLGLGLLAEACEVGWQQGLDMYGAKDNRLLHGFEYTAEYLLGNEVPFVEFRDTTGKYHAVKISSRGRRRMRPVFEMVWGHYHSRRGGEAPFLGQALQRVRPEGQAHGADHPGFGTLLFSRDDGRAGGGVP